MRIARLLLGCRRLSTGQPSPAPPSQDEDEGTLSAQTYLVLREVLPVFNLSLVEMLFCIHRPPPFTAPALSSLISAIRLRQFAINACHMHCRSVTSPRAGTCGSKHCANAQHTRCCLKVFHHVTTCIGQRMALRGSVTIIQGQQPASPGPDGASSAAWRLVNTLSASIDKMLEGAPSSACPRCDRSPALRCRTWSS